MEETWHDGLHLQLLWAAERIGHRHAMHEEKHCAQERMILANIMEDLSEDSLDWLPPSPTPKPKGT